MDYDTELNIHFLRCAADTMTERYIVLTIAVHHIGSNITVSHYIKIRIALWFLGFLNKLLLSNSINSKLHKS